MKIFTLYKVILLVNLFLIGCSTNKYISQIEVTNDFEGEWLINNQQNRTLIISKIEDHIYNLKFNSENNNWEGIGYQIDGNLLAIFKYQSIDQKGYITFSFIDKDKIIYESINTDGTFRSKGYYVKFKSP